MNQNDEQVVDTPIEETQEEVENFVDEQSEDAEEAQSESDEVVEKEDTPSQEDRESELLKQIAILKRQNTKLQKATKPVRQETQKPELQAKPSSRQETIVTSKLLDEGLTPTEVDEHLDELYYIAERDKTSLVEAAESRRYKSFKDAFTAEKKEKSAQMTASKSSGISKKSKDFRTKGLTPEEHRALWDKNRKG